MGDFCLNGATYMFFKRGDDLKNLLIAHFCKAVAII